MRRACPGFATLVVLLLAACAPKASLYADNGAAESHDVRVIAGDRFVIDGRQIILADAETPRPVPQAGCRAEAMAAVRAADAVRSALASARHLEMHVTGEGSGLGLVNVDGLDLGQELIEQGLAVSRQAVTMDWCYRLQPLGEQMAAQIAPGGDRRP